VSHSVSGRDLERPISSREKLIRLDAVRARVPLSKASIYRLQAQNKFPHSVSIGPNSVAWTESSIDAWIQERIAGSIA